MASSWRISFLIMWLVTSYAMGFPWLLPSLSSTRTCLRCRLTFTQHTHTHSISIPDQHRSSTHPCLHCSPAPTQRTHMSPSLASTHPCLHCWPAPTQRTPMSPFLASKHPPTPTKATAVLLPAVGCSRVVPRKYPEMCYLTKVSWPPGLPYCNLYYEAGTPGRRKKNNNNNNPVP